jgi:hypothetical protein
MMRNPEHNEHRLHKENQLKQFVMLALRKDFKNFLATNDFPRLVATSSTRRQ